MSSQEIKYTMVSFWQTVLESFFLANYGITYQEMLKQETVKEISTFGNFYGKEKCERRAKRFVNNLYNVNTSECWERTVEYVKKNVPIPQYFKIDENGKVLFSVNAFECSTPIDNAPNMLRLWKQYKIN